MGLVFLVLAQVCAAVTNDGVDDQNCVEGVDEDPMRHTPGSGACMLLFTVFDVIHGVT